MANLHRIQLVQLLIVCISASSSSIHGVDEGAIGFQFPPQTNLTESGDASISDHEIQLTRDKINSGLDLSLGWVVYSDFIPLWDNSTQAVASFSTHFQFVISKASDKKATGDGLTFFLAPTGLNISNSSPGEYLGLFKNTTDGNTSNQIVAVEFDTFTNDQFDPDDNHVGIDVNSRKSKRTVSVYSLFGNAALNNGKKWDAWVDYDGTVDQLQVFLQSNPDGTTASKPGSPVLWYDIDLRQYLPQNVKVGFSASTGEAIETHTVYIWNFSCQYSWKISTPAAAPEVKFPSPAPETTVPRTAPDVNVTGPGQIKTKNSSVKIKLISVFACLVTIPGLILVGSIWYIKTRESNQERGGVGSNGEESDGELNKSLREAAQSAHEFLYDDLCSATNNFSDGKRIGVGGFGFVYRGTLPGSNEAVAIKRISPSSMQGKREYETEISINSKLTHHNLVKFLGWCHRKGDLLLVYELLPNGSLDKYIIGKPEAPLDWDRRYSIACDVESALVYLHEDRHESVVHRDIKASNVMLDSNFKAKLGDFGLARMVEREKEGHTTMAAGTIGYIAPEFLTTGKATREMDVFSFGALCLEIACGRPPRDWNLTEHNCRVVEWVWHLYGQHTILDAADNKLGGNFNGEEMERLMKVGLLCSHPDPHARPTMEKVVGILKRGAELPHVPLKFPVAVYGDHITPDALTSSSSSTFDGIASMVFTTPSEVNATLWSRPSRSISSMPLLLHSGPHLDSDP